MTVNILKKPIYFKPDARRVLARYFAMSTEKGIKVIQRVLQMSKREKADTLNQVLRNFSKRHRSILKILAKNYKRTEAVVKGMGIRSNDISYQEKLLIGAYFTLEYSIEAAAFFNPSIVVSPDQTQLEEGELRVILSFRATGEGHVSSIVFRSGVINNNLDIQLDEVGGFLEKPKLFKSYEYRKADFIAKLLEMHHPQNDILAILDKKFSDTFTYEELRRYVFEIQKEHQLSFENKTLMSQIMWLASSHYQMSYSLDTSISERVIFPISDTEKNGIEDARFVCFKGESGKVIYYATYTAFDGFTVLPKLMSTRDFVKFKVQPINGKIANKGSALFPRKINGRYAMLCRVDGENNYIAFSDDIVNWQQEITLLKEPRYPWEFVQQGNCGSPIETEAGWLVLTHGVGPMREYTISAILLDLDNPTKVIKSLHGPLISPNAEEREGYVPNVVYSCGQLLHNGYLIIPYAMSDYASTYAVVNLGDLLQKMS